MGYLGLDATPVKDDNLFQRLFWPSDHAGETDTLGQQGFWVCLIVAVVSFALMMLRGQWVLGPITFLFYGLGGVGVREHSQPAAVLVAVGYLLEELTKLFAFAIPPGGIDIVITLLLFANVRGTWVAAKWADSGPTDVMPERMNETLTDRLVDQMPAKVWPKLKILFFAVAVFYIPLALLTTVVFALQAPARLKATHSTRFDDSTAQPPQ